MYSVLFGICMLSLPIAYGQEQETTTPMNSIPTLRPTFGIKGGVNFSNLYVENIQDEQVKIGMLAGLFVKIPLTQRLSFQPELLYSSKGAQLTYNNVAQGQGAYRFNLNYIELPMTLVFNIVKNFNLHAGGYVAYLANANVKDMQKDGTVVGVMDLNENSFNRFDYGVVGGLGVDIGKFGIGARYNYGMNTIGKSGTVAGDFTSNSKNSALSLFLAFGF